MALMTDRRTWLWVAVILGAGALVSSLSLSRGDADVAVFVGLSAFSGALAIAMRGCSPDERIRLAEMRAAERAMTITTLIGSAIGATVLIGGGDPTPWLVMTAIAIAVSTATSAVAILRS